MKINMKNATLNKQAKLSEHFTLGELCKTSVNSLDGNIPSQEDVENLKRLCPWLEELRFTYNKKYVLVGGRDSPPESGGDRGGLNGGESGACSGLNKGAIGDSSDHPAHPGTPPDSGGELNTEEPIVITSGYRSPEVNRCVGERIRATI